MPTKQSSGDSKSQQMNLDSLAAGVPTTSTSTSPSSATVSLDTLQSAPASSTPSPVVSSTPSVSPPTQSFVIKPDPVSGTTPTTASGDAISVSTPSVTLPSTNSAPEKTSESQHSSEQYVDVSPLDLSKITSSPTTKPNSSTNQPVLLGDSHTQKTLQQTPRPTNWAGIILSISQRSIIIGVLVGVFSYGYQWFLIQAAAHPVDPSNQATIDTIKAYEQELNALIPLNSYVEYQALSFVAPNAKANLDAILVADTINYVHKKDLLNAGFGSLSQSLLSTAQQIDQLKQTIATNGGMDKIEYDLMKQDSAVSIQKSLMTVEVIKLSTALKVFYYLDSFINQFSAAVGLEPDVVKQQMETMIARGEVDIQRYIQSCYMNPFESENDCAVTKDFVNQYQYLDSQQTVDPAFVVAILQFIDQKLENTTLPNLTLTFSNFDPKSDILTLNIEVNTFQEDELGLISKGILNPHIFVVTNLINLLKQSTFIKDEGIDVKTLKINKKKLRVANKEFVVNNSTFTFTVPIQKSTARDISDYIK